jgi:hypothetical protein
MQKIIFCSLLIAVYVNATAQLTIERSTIFFLQQKASIYVEGDLSSNSDIVGPGYIELGGDQIHHVNLNGFSINNLLINAAAPVILNGDMSIFYNIMLRSGHLQLNNHNIILKENASIVGSKKSYVQTAGSGAIQKMVAGNLNNYHIPLGTSQFYMPLEISTNGKKQNGLFEVTASDRVSSHKPANATDFLNYHWKIRQEGNLENLTATGHYSLQDVQGNAGRLSSYYWNGLSWTPQTLWRKQSAKVIANITPGSGELYAMNDVRDRTFPYMKLLKNPARSFTVLEINAINDKAYHIVLSDVTGRQLQQKDLKATRGTSHHTFYLEGLANGVYFLDVISVNDKKSFRVLKVQ